HAARPVLWREERDVDVEEESEMVLNQVLARNARVERVKVLKLAAQLLEPLLRDTRRLRLRRKFAAAKDVVPDLVRHLLGRDAGWANLLAVDGRVQKVRDSVVS